MFPGPSRHPGVGSLFPGGLPPGMTGLPPNMPGIPSSGPARLDLPVSLGGSFPPPRGSDPLMSLVAGAGPSAPSVPGTPASAASALTRAPSASDKPGVPRKLGGSIIENCDRIKEEFNYIQNQLDAAKLECEKLAQEKTEMQRSGISGNGFLKFCTQIFGIEGVKRIFYNFDRQKEHCTAFV